MRWLCFKSRECNLSQSISGYSRSCHACLAARSLWSLQNSSCSLKVIRPPRHRSASKSCLKDKLTCSPQRGHGEVAAGDISIASSEPSTDRLVKEDDLDLELNAAPRCSDNADVSVLAGKASEPTPWGGRKSGRVEEELIWDSVLLAADGLASESGLLLFSPSSSSAPRGLRKLTA